MTKEQIAEVCHGVNKAYCEALGDTSQPEWKDAPQWQKDSALLGVELHLAHPDAGPEQSHESWLAQKKAEGWGYGPVKDPAKKEHPCCVPFNELPTHQQAKDFIFRAIVKQLGALVSVLLLFVVAGCAQSSETVRHGDTSFLLTQTQNQWAENVVLVSECEKDLVNGMCKPKGEVKVLVISGKLPELVGGLKHDAVSLGSAFVIRDGLIKSKANVKQNNQTDIRASTVNPKQ